MAKPRIVLIGLDGATFSVLDPLIQAGVMPFLRDFTASGVRAGLRSTIPALTPPAWTSLMTGRSPGQHGIFDFFRRESPESHHIRFLTSRDIEGETLWSLLSRQGLRSTVLNFPVMFPPPAIDGYVVPGGWMPWKQLRLGCHPEDLYDRLKQLPGFNPRELAMDMSHEEKAIEGCERDEYEDWIDLHIRRERQWFNVTRYLMEDDPTELVAILFDGVDKLQHLCWRFIDPAYEHTITSEWERRVRDKCRNYFRQLDTFLENIVELAGPKATVAIASDHGFGPQQRTFFVNAWLEKEGFLAWKDDAGPQSTDSQTIGIGHLARHVYELDWEQTRAYAPLPSGNGIHIVRAGETSPHGVTEAEYESFRDWLIEELLQVTDPRGSVQVVSRVWKREEIFAGPHLELAPDLTLELEDGGLVSILASETIVSPRPEPSGTHRPEGTFIASGPELRQGIHASELSILDVPPMLLYSLGLSIPAEFEGAVPIEVLEPQVLQKRPVRVTKELESGVPKEDPDQAEHEQIYDAEAEAEMLKRLRALGYIE